MSKFEIIDFAKAAKQSVGEPKHLVLGNGFCKASGAVDFDYRRLLAKASKDKKFSHCKALFKQRKTCNFEVMLGSLGRWAELVELYGQAGAKVARSMHLDQKTIQLAFSSALSKCHPGCPSQKLSGDPIPRCAKFLNRFRTIYTLNHDALLYWVICDRRTKHKHDDGFRGSGDLVWSASNYETAKRVYYLHGALFIVARDGGVGKLKWKSSSNSLIAEVLHAVDRSEYPLVVCEGTWREKEDRIFANEYLRFAFQQLCMAEGSLFVLGWSIRLLDDHIRRAISSNNRLTRVFVGLHGDEAKRPNSHIVRAALRWKSRTRSVTFFHAESAPVWTAFA